MQAQLSCLFNHAVRFYELPSNPVHRAGALGAEEADEMLFGRRKNPLDLYQPWQINLIHTMHLNFYIGAESVWEN